MHGLPHGTLSRPSRPFVDSYVVGSEINQRVPSGSHWLAADSLEAERLCRPRPLIQEPRLSSKPREGPVAKSEWPRYCSDSRLVRVTLYCICKNLRGPIICLMSLEIENDAVSYGGQENGPTGGYGAGRWALRRPCGLGLSVIKLHVLAVTKPRWPLVLEQFTLTSKRVVLGWNLWLLIPVFGRGRTR